MYVFLQDMRFTFPLQNGRVLFVVDDSEGGRGSRYCFLSCGFTKAHILAKRLCKCFSFAQTRVGFAG